MDSLDLDTIASGDSVIHRLNGVVKLLSVIAIIVFCVASNQLIVPIILEIFLLIVMYFSKISFRTAFKRILLLLPFGGMIVIFQPFIHPGHVIWQYSWLTISDVGLNFGILLFFRLIVSLTAIVLLSSTSPMQQIVASLRKLKLPKDLAMILSIMVRFLFVFLDELDIVRKAQKSRDFDIHSKLTPYKWRVKQVGYSIAMMFLKAYEQGESTYQSMVSRGFSEDSDFFNEKTTLNKSDYVFIGFLIMIFIITTIIVIIYSGHLGYFGQNLGLHKGVI